MWYDFKRHAHLHIWSIAHTNQCLFLARCENSRYLTYTLYHIITPIDQQIDNSFNHAGLGPADEFHTDPYRVDLRWESPIVHTPNWTHVWEFRVPCYECRLWEKLYFELFVAARRYAALTVVRFHPNAQSLTLLRTAKWKNVWENTRNKLRCANADEIHRECTYASSTDTNKSTSSRIYLDNVHKHTCTQIFIPMFTCVRISPAYSLHPSTLPLKPRSHAHSSVPYHCWAISKCRLEQMLFVRYSQTLTRHMHSRESRSSTHS